MSDTAPGHGHDPAPYEIRVGGHLDSRWAAWFDGLHLRTASDGTTVLTGLVVDQAALYGVLLRLRDAGLPLVSVNQVHHPVTAPTEALTTDRR